MPTNQELRATTHSPTAGPADPLLIEDLVAANRILAQEGVLDGWGHVSVRHDRDPNRYLLSRSLAPELVAPATWFCNCYARTFRAVMDANGDRSLGAQAAPVREAGAPITPWLRGSLPNLGGVLDGGE